MGRFTVIPENAFSALQLDAGVLLKNFDPANPTIADADLICATTGGINPVCKPTFSDFGEDVDNVPNNMMEFKHLDGWECSISTTSLGTSPELIKMALGCADIDGTDTSTQDVTKVIDQLEHPVKIKHRKRIVAAILRNELEKNLGLTGSGQDVSIMRSTLLRPGVLCQDEEPVKINLLPSDNKLKNLLCILIIYIIIGLKEVRLI